jgi:hypothetical protein
VWLCWSCLHSLLRCHLLTTLFDCSSVHADKGFLQYLQWYDLTCNSCGGLTSQVCLHQVGTRCQMQCKALYRRLSMTSQLILDLLCHPLRS